MVAQLQDAVREVKVRFGDEAAPRPPEPLTIVHLACAAHCQSIRSTSAHQADSTTRPHRARELVLARRRAPRSASPNTRRPAPGSTAARGKAASPSAPTRARTRPSTSRALALSTSSSSPPSTAPHPRHVVHAPRHPAQRPCARHCRSRARPLRRPDGLCTGQVGRRRAGWARRQERRQRRRHALLLVRRGLRRLRQGPHGDRPRRRRRSRGASPAPRLALALGAR